MLKEMSRSWDSIDEAAEREGNATSKAAKTGQLTKLSGTKGKRHGQVSKESNAGLQKHVNRIVRRIARGG